MPKATIDKHSDLRSHEQDVDSNPGNSPLQAVPQAKPPQSGAQTPLRGRVSSLHPTHLLRPGEWHPSLSKMRVTET